jgi:hypothetical protein
MTQSQIKRRLQTKDPPAGSFSAVGLERILFVSAQRPRQTLIRVPVVIVGDIGTV